MNLLLAAVITPSLGGRCLLMDRIVSHKEDNRQCGRIKPRPWRAVKDGVGRTHVLRKAV